MPGTDDHTVAPRETGKAVTICDRPENTGGRESVSFLMACNAIGITVPGMPAMIVDNTVGSSFKDACSSGFPENRLLWEGPGDLKNRVTRQLISRAGRQIIPRAIKGKIPHLWY